MDRSEYIAMCSDNGRKGGKKKAENRRAFLEKASRKAINLYVNDLTLNQSDIAEICGISQSYVSKCTEGLSKIRKANKSTRKTINQEEVLKVISIFHTNQKIEMEFLKQVFEDNQEEIDSDFKL
ncbi:hypothetical protein [Acidovorax sp. CCYZU-2555]|uniref:hypothetical protein n=1 Tax=Acidovorax sp. CCYZU-2555 TaxID=2835042 RepID=UPI001BD09012|nr:hypothetical protein [Acidovorax sp. CCYZU-2555]MBS7776920.1 hypothetical protein [Acidovorax sp. CCYZU-2555]